MTREEALNEIRSWAIPSEKGREVLETLIPELAESEDERIRLFICDLITHIFWGIGWDISKKDCLAYLEKQKDLDKMIVVSPDVWDNAINDAYENGKRDGEKQKEQKPVDLSEMMVHKEPYIAPVPTPMVADEQKPAEWSDTDNIGWGEAFACVTRAEKAAKNEEELQNAVTAEEWLKEIKFKYYVHPVKQEWSEEDALNRAYEEGFNDGLKCRKPVNRSDEDRKMAHWLIGLVNANTELSFSNKTNLTRWLEHLTVEKELSKNDKRIIDAIMIGYQDKDFRSSQIPTPIGVSKGEVIAWLKSLPERFNIQPKQEWSEKGEKILDSLIRLYGGEYSAKAWPWSDGVITYGDVVNFLKSLRPSWKPGKEQMDALERCIDYLDESDNDDFRIMLTLYEQLVSLEASKLEPF